MHFTGNGISHKNFRELLAHFRKDMKCAFCPKAVVDDSDSEPEHDGDVEMDNDNEIELESEGEDVPMDVDNEDYNSESTNSDEDSQKDLGNVEEETDHDDI